MIRDPDNIVLTVDLPEHQMRRGDLGTVVLLHGDRGCEVEFVALNGDALAVVSLDKWQVRPIGSGEIAHARQIAAA